MRRRLLASVTTLAAGAALIAATRAPNPDEQAIRRTVQYYFDGTTNADSGALRQAFHQEARMLWVKEGKFALMPIGEFIGKVGANTGKPADGVKVEKRVALVDVTGNAAVAKLEIVRPEKVITDYMSLLKVDGQWVIVNKIFDGRMRPTTSASN